MKRIEHLLFIIAEECAEVAQRASKAARFGLDEVQPGQDHDNMLRLWLEFNDLYAAMQMLHDETGFNGLSYRHREAKIAKEIGRAHV